MQQFAHTLIQFRLQLEATFSPLAVQFAPFSLALLAVILLLFVSSIRGARGTGILSILLSAVVVFAILVIGVLTLPFDRMIHPPRPCVSSTDGGKCMAIACQENDHCDGMPVACIPQLKDGSTPDPMSAPRIALLNNEDWPIKKFGFGAWSNESCKSKGDGWYAEQPGCGTKDAKSALDRCAFMVVRPTGWQLFR